MQTTWLPDPDGPEEVLAEARLEPATGDAVARAVAGAAGEVLSEDDLRDLPVVSIGKPEHVPLREVYVETPPAVQALLGADDFHLVRLSCSFLPRKDDVKIQWARFLAHLLADDDGRQPTVFDLYPREVMREIERDVSVSLSPSVKFSEVEAGLGSVAFGYKYADLQPLVTAVEIEQGTKAVWDYEQAKGVPVRGWKKMYLLAKAPRGMAYGEARLAVTADIVVRGKLRLPVLLRPSEAIGAPGVTARLWG